MNTKLLSTLLLSVFILSGCGAGLTQQQLKQHKDTKISTYTKNVNYQEEYIRAQALLKGCYEWKMVYGAGQQVIGDIYNDLGKAQISVAFIGNGKPVNNILVELEKIDSTKTKVTIFNKYSNTNVKALLADNKPCDIKK